jgi:hypothetical protein
MRSVIMPHEPNDDCTNLVLARFDDMHHNLSMQTKPTTPAQLRRLAKRAADLYNAINEAKYNMPSATNSENEFAMYSVLSAISGTVEVESKLSSAASYLADQRTQAEIDAEQVILRAENQREELRAAQIKQYGFAVE